MTALVNDVDRRRLNLHMPEELLEAIDAQLRYRQLEQRMTKTDFIEYLLWRGLKEDRQ